MAPFLHLKETKMYEIYLMVNFNPDKHYFKYFIFNPIKDKGAWYGSTASIANSEANLELMEAYGYELELETSVDTFEEATNYLELTELLD